MKLSKIFFILFLLTLLALIWWSFPIIRNRYFNTSNTPTNNNGTPQQLSTTNSNDNQSQNADPQSGAIPQTTSNQNASDNSFLHITPAVCDSQCKPFADNNKDLQYCQEVCGLAPLSIPKNGTCDNLKALEKDYCLKNLAVSKKNMPICDQIQDSGIKKTCQNRITEDLLQRQIQNSPPLPE